MIQTAVQKTAGTVAIVDGSASITGTSTSFVSGDKRSFIQFASDTNWYEVIGVSGQTLTLALPFSGTSNATSGYTLRKVFYDLTSDVNRIISVRQSTSPIKLANLGIWSLDLYQPDITQVSQPTGYALFRQDPDTAVSAVKVRQITFWPIPDAVYNIEVRYFKVLSDLSADTDVPSIPTVYQSVLVDGAEWLGSKYINASDEGSLKQQYEYGLQKMIEQENAHDDYFPVLEASDARQDNSRFLPFPPGQFEQPQ